MNEAEKDLQNRGCWNEWKGKICGIISSNGRVELRNSNPGEILSLTDREQVGKTGEQQQKL